MNIKEILIEERKKRGYTQQDIADYLQMARGSYAKYETGTNIPTTENILKLADLYNLTTDYLLGRKKSKTKPFKKSCENCEFNMPNNEGILICAGREKEYGQPTPIKNINYDDCWEISFSEFCKQQEKLKDNKAKPNK